MAGAGAGRVAGTRCIRGAKPCHHQENAECNDSNCVVTYLFAPLPDTPPAAVVAPLAMPSLQTSATAAWLRWTTP
jgi:hypothetical protein